jgi:hypothetical protein
MGSRMRAELFRSNNGRSSTTTVEKTRRYAQPWGRSKPTRSWALITWPGSCDPRAEASASASVQSQLGCDQEMHDREEEQMKN